MGRLISCRSNRCCCPSSFGARTDGTTDRFPSGRSPPSRCRGSRSCEAKTRRPNRTHIPWKPRTHDRVESYQFLFSIFYVAANLTARYQATSEPEGATRCCRDLFLLHFNIHIRFRNPHLSVPTCRLPHKGLLGCSQAMNRQGSSPRASSELS